MKNIFASIKDKLSEYFRLRFEVIRLELIEKLVTVMGYFVFVILALLLFFSAVLFVGFGLAEWFSTLFNSRAGGYFATAGVLFIVTVITLLSSKHIVGFFANKMVWMLTKNKGDEDDEKDEE